LIARDFVECDIKDFRSGRGVNVAAFAEGVEQACVFGKCSENT
jgi:hypothetical protein